MSISLSLTDSQREMMKEMKRKTSSRVKATRCRIILLRDAREPVSRIASLVDCVRSTVYTALYRFENKGLESFWISAGLLGRVRRLRRCEQRF